MPTQTSPAAVTARRHRYSHLAAVVALLVSLLSTFVHVPAADASLRAKGGQITWSGAPDDARRSKFEHDGGPWGWNEIQDGIFNTGVRVDFCHDSYSAITLRVNELSDLKGRACTIPKHTYIDSHFIHGDRKTHAGRFTEWEGWVDFDTPILGVIVDNYRTSPGRLDNSDELGTRKAGGSLKTRFSTGDGHRGMDFKDSPTRVPNPEWVEVTKHDRSRLSFKIANAGGTDQIRVITKGTNHAPTLTGSSSVSVPEGKNPQRSGSFSDANFGDHVSLSASVGNLTRTGDGNGGTWKWTGPRAVDGPSSYPVTITGTDRGGKKDTVTFTVNVSNVPPAATLSAPSPIGENATFTLSLSARDVPADTFTYQFDCGDGTWQPSTPTSSSAFSCRAPDDAPATPLSLTVRGKVIDDDGGWDVDAATVAVENRDPSAQLVVSAPVNEGSDFTLSLIDGADDSDADEARLQHRFDCGAGVWTAWSLASSTTCPSGDGTAATNELAVAGEVRDDDGGDNSYGATVDVLNLAPTAAFVAPASVRTAHDFELELRDGTDPYPGDVLSYDFHCGDGTWSTPGTSTVHGCTAGTTPGTITVGGRIADDDADAVSGFTLYNATVEVLNTAPSATLDAPEAVDEGTSFVLTATSVEDDEADRSTLAYGFDCGDGAGVLWGTSTSVTCATDDGPVDRTVTLQLRDQWGAVSQIHIATVSIRNVGVIGVLGAPSSVDEASPFTLTATELFDPSQADTDHGFGFQFDCGEGWLDWQAESSEACTVDDGRDHVTTVGVRIRDKDQASAGQHTEYTQQLIVNNVAPTTVVTPSATGVPEAGSFTVTAGPSDDVSDTDDAAGFTYAFDCGTGDGYSAFGTTDTVSCAALDDGLVDGTIQTVRVSVQDKDQGSREYEIEVTVHNVAPTASFTPPAIVDEGSDFTLALTDPSDPSETDTGAGFTYAFDCGPGYGDFGSATSATCAAVDDGPTSITVAAKIRDKDGGVTEYTGTVGIANVAPIGTLGAPEGSIPEASSFTLSIDGVTDPSGADTTAGFIYGFDCDGDETYETTGATSWVTCAALDDGPASQPVSARVSDVNGGTSTYSTTVLVANVAPTADWSYDSTVPEGSDFGLSLTNPVDPSTTDTTVGFDHQFDCGDGAGLSVAGTANTRSCPTTDDGSRSVQGRISDKNSGATDYVGTVEVTNVAPTATIVAPAAVDEASTFTLELADASDPSSVDTAAGFTYAFDCGNGYGSAGAASTTTCPAPDDGPTGITVRATITDKDGGSTEYSQSVTVNNVAPTGTFTAPTQVTEGDTIVLSLTNLHDPSAIDTADGLTVEYSCDGGTTWSTTGTCATVDDAVVAVAARVADKDGGMSTYTGSVTVNNGAPTIGNVVVDAPTVACQGETNDVTISFTVSDPATETHDPIAGTVDWGDGSSTLVSGRTASVSHAYAPGTWAASITVDDGDGGTDEHVISGGIAILYATSMGRPIAADGSSVFHHNQTVPVKVSITDCAGAAVKGLAPTVSLTLLGDPETSVPVVVAAGKANTANIMRSAGGHYIYNLSLDRSRLDGDVSLPLGGYRVTVSDPSIAPSSAEFEVR